MSENSKRMKGSRYRCLLATELESGKARKLLEDICRPLQDQKPISNTIQSSMRIKHG